MPDYPVIAIETYHNMRISQFMATIYSKHDVNGQEVLGNYDYLQARYQPWPAPYTGGRFGGSLRDYDPDNNPGPLGTRHDETRQWSNIAYNDLKQQLVGTGLVVDESNSFGMVNPPDSGQVEAYPPIEYTSPGSQWNAPSQYDRWMFRTYEPAAGPCSSTGPSTPTARATRRGTCWASEGP